MALANLGALQTAMQYPTQHCDYLKVMALLANNGTTWTSSWKQGGFPAAGATPTASAVCDKTTAGAIPIVNAGSGELRMWVKRCIAGRQLGVTGGFGGFMIVDRLNHQGGLDATVTTAQTVSTAALTRSMTGAGVYACLENYVALGTTQTTAIGTYTNQAGTSGQVFQPTPYGWSSGGGSPNKIIPLSLASGDTGVRAVADVTLAATTGSAGNFGVTMLQPLTPWISIENLYSTAFHPLLDGGGFAPLVPTDACLQVIFQCTTATGYDMIDLNFFED